MRKIVNLRLPVLLALAMVFGVTVGCFFQYYDLSPVWLAGSVAFCALLAIIFAITLRKHLSTVILALIPLFIIGGCLNSYLKINSFNQKEILERRYYVYGVVYDKVDTDERSYIIIDNASADGVKLGGKIRATLPESYGEFCDVGYKVGFYAILHYEDTFAYGKLNNRVLENVKYNCVAADVKSEYKFNVFNAVRLKIKSVLYDNLDEDTASVCYAMLTGNTSFVENDTLQSFRYGGIAHVFAVSGLHIGVIFGLCKLLFKKTGRWCSSAISIVLIFVYAGICGFTPSSLRAAIMCTVSVLSSLLKIRHDGLNSLSYAVMIILLISPLEAFGIGFQLSVCAMGGIYCFSKIFEAILLKIKTPRKIASAVGVSFGAQAGTMPVMLSNFGYLSAVGLTLNLIFVPLISALFSVVFLCTAFCSVFTGLGKFIMPTAAIPLELLLSFIVDAGFEKSLITGFGAGIFVPLYFLTVLCVSDKINFNFVARIISACSAVIILAACTLCMTFLPVNGYKIIVSGSYLGGKVIFKNSQGNVLVIDENCIDGYTASFLNEYYSTNLDAVIILGSENGVMKFGGLNNDCRHVYIFSDYIPVFSDSRTTYHYEKNFAVNGINFFFIDGYSIIAVCDGLRIGITEGEFVPFGNCDLLISKVENASCEASSTVYYDLKEQKYNIYEYGDLVFRIKDGEIKKTSLNPVIYK